MRKLIKDIQANDSSLVEACLPNEFLEKESVEQFLAALESNTTVKTVRLDNHDLSGELFSNVAKLLEKNTVITTLYLRNTKLTNQELALLARGLRQHKNLEALHLDNNCFTYDGLNALLDVLKILPLVTLSLSFNERLKDVSDESIAKLVELFNSCHSLQNFYISCCPMGNRGINSLIESWKQHSSIRTISLRGTGINNDCIDNLASAIKESSITQINLDWNPDISPENKKLIQALIEQKAKSLAKQEESPQTLFRKRSS